MKLRRSGSTSRARAQKARLSKRVATPLALAAACSLAATANAGATSVHAPHAFKGTVNVGVLGAFSGNIPYGQFWEKGAQVAANYIDANGGIMGQKINLIPEDDGLDPVDAVTVGRKMLAIDHPKLVLGLAVIDWRDVMPILEAAHVVSFTQIADPYLDTHLLPYSFAADPSDALEGVAMVRYVQQKGYKRIALVFDEESNAQTLLPAIQAAAKRAHIAVVADPTLPVGVPSYQAEVQQVMAAKPDVILTQVAPNTAGTLFPEFDAAGGKNIPLVGSDSTLEPPFVSAASQLGIESSLVSVEAYSSIASQGGRVFLEGYKRMFHSASYDVRSTYAYDGMTVAALAMTAAHSTDPSVYVHDITKVTTPGPGITNVYTYQQGVRDLRKGMRIKYVGVGSNMTYNRFHRVSGAFEVAKIVNGAPRKVTVISADSVAALNGK